MKLSSVELEEFIDQYLTKGGRIKRYTSRADEIAANQIIRTKYWSKSEYIQELVRRKKESRMKKLSLRKAHNRVATDPGGRIEPGRPSKPWPNHKKTGLLRPLATSAAR